MSELGIVPGTHDLVAPVVHLDAPPDGSRHLHGVEVFVTDVAQLTTSSCHFHDAVYQVVMPNPTHFIPRITEWVRANVCSGAEPWDHLRLHISVCSISKKLFFGIFWVFWVGFGVG